MNFLFETELDYIIIMTSLSFNQLLDILKNNNFNFYYNNPRQRPYKSKVVIDSNSISYKQGIIKEDCINDIYLFDNQYINFKDYHNHKDISIQLINKI
jgi:hypothetical protein